MSPKRGDSVAQPAIGEEWEIRFATSDAVRGWAELVNAAATNVRQAWETMRTDPGPGPGKPTARHHRLKGELAIGTYKGEELPQWQIEVTGAGRVIYLLDAERHTIWVKLAGVGHPKLTE